MVKELMLEMILLAIVVITQAVIAAASTARPGCPEMCGNVTIPYPFGIGGNCYADEVLAISCNESFNPPKPFIESINLEVLHISLHGNVTVNNPVTSFNCPHNRKSGGVVNLGETPFSFSKEYNVFTAMGCNSIALIMDQQAKIVSGCVSICNNNNITAPTYEASCYGINCCQTTFPLNLKYLDTSLQVIDPINYHNECTYAFMVDADWFESEAMSSHAVQNLEYVPAVLDWRADGSCNSFEMSSSSADNSSVSSLCGSNASCLEKSSIYHQCRCDDGYDGNPYLPHGCEDINECLDSKLNKCQNICINTPGGYKCSCPYGYFLYNEHKCAKEYDMNGNKALVTTTGGMQAMNPIVIATGLRGIVFTDLVILILLLGTWWMWQIVKRRKKTKLKEKLFKQNGGLLLQQQLSSSSECNVEKTKVFTSRELEQATDHYNVSRILGQGGQGTVYKGMLTDGRIVAVKKSMIRDKGGLEHFINEVVILSQINHRNVVKLLGCCLETEVPLLVYEFIPNGTLSQHLHDPNDEFPLSWDMRLRIATEVAGALSYLHSAASLPIYHRDVKSTNILLDDKYRAKVADFGTSRSINIDQTHLTTRVLGTFGYLDPEYFRSSQFTEKSDVYSFGVVLVELLTGQKVISSTRCEEERGLATYFISTMKNNCLYDIVDARVKEEGVKEEMMEVANLAKRCLNLNGRKRPTMKEVAMELEGIRTSHGATISQQNYEEIECSSVAEQVEPWDVDVDLASTSTSSCSDHL